MLKKFLVLAMPFIFVLGLTFNFEVNAASDQITVEDQKQAYKEELANLTQDEVIANFERIDKEYAMEEPFSAKDQTFIEMYAKKPSAMTLFTSKSISGSNSSNGVTVKVSGTIKDDIQNVVNQSFSASNLKTSTTAGASKVSSVKTVVYHNAYGLVGSGGVGKVYSGTLSTSGKNTTLTATKRYTAVVAYASTWCTVTVKHSGGTFTVNPK
ncbi:MULTISPECIES: hypothetical protein [Priestia]|uniref:hypothetical protein n=1 Tax=Priestia TaxID=2800373 RepID=UPI00094D9FEE|nr:MULTISPECIES: hypothetical protein [Priestia]MBY0090299.1 hypothetical protein [Priestia aryabhattai]MBY0100113.1 hypothetical protein [Priestia aryabhattai]MCM3098956.1 hypothetical protein [Priestia megaterium]MCM3303244.1 hypothetical protein [Priestia megaterium]MED4140041.1 hypothetical protein [Priestia megaterium]